MPTPGVVEVVKDVGLITCWEDGISPQGNTPHWTKAQWCNSLDAVDIGEEVQVRVQIECGREEVNDGGEQEKDRTRTQPTDDQTHIVDGMKME